MPGLLVVLRSCRERSRAVDNITHPWPRCAAKSAPGSQAPNIKLHRCVLQIKQYSTQFIKKKKTAPGRAADGTPNTPYHVRWDCYET